MAATQDTPAAAASVPLPPHDPDAEESILGAMMLSPAACDAVAAIVDAADFYRESNGRIFRAALSLHRLGQPVDQITVADRLEETGELDQIATDAQDGRTRVHELAALAVAAGNAAHYARIVAREARRRQLADIGARIAREALTGDPDTIRALANELLADADREDRTAAPKVATLDDFIGNQEEGARALIGDKGNTLLPEGGLLILGGEGGASKTTLTLDAIAHLASGTPWLGYRVQQPVRILVLENEGPRAQFRDKLRDKTNTWTGQPFRNNVIVWEEPWADFSFARENDRRHLRDIVDEHHIDLVAADPLDSLGIIGAGTPEDTRQFISWLRESGLHNPDRPLAFWLLHHFNKSGQKSVVAQLSGAWGNHPDAILGVELADGQTTKLTWGKLRHATPPVHRTIVLAWDIDTRGFTIVEQAPQDGSDKIRDSVLLYVTDHPGQARSAVEEGVHGGVTASRNAVRQVIDRLLNEDPPQLAVGPGKSPNGKYLYPASTLNSLLADPAFGETARRTQPGNDEPHEYSTRRGETSHGETARPSPSLPDRGTRGEEERAPLKGALLDGELTETATPHRLADPAAYIEDTGWMLRPDDLTAELLTRWPSLTAPDLTQLLQHAANLAAAERGAEDLPTHEKKGARP